MSRDARLVAEFLDGEEYVFRLAWGQWIRLQEERGVGPFVIFERLHGDAWLVEDIRDVIRFGLVGGGMDEISARKLVRTHVETQPPHLSLQLAQQIAAAGMLGAPDGEPLEKKVEAPSESIPSTTAASKSPNSMESVQ